MDEDTGRINYKKNYNLTSDELNSINFKSTPTKVIRFLNLDQESATNLLNGFATERTLYYPNINPFNRGPKFREETMSIEEATDYYEKPNAISKFDRVNFNLTNVSIGNLYRLAQNGGTNFGRYKFTSEEIIEDVESGAFEGMGNEKFTEDNQSYLLVALLRNRANRSNSINGAVTEAKDWHRLTNLSLEEQEAVLQLFPNLRGMKNNQFQNLQADVAEIIITEAEKLRNDKAAKEKAEEEAAKLKAEQTFNPKTLYK